LGENILEENGTQLGLNIINTINEENEKCSNILKTPHNCEQIPAETVSVKLASKDRLLKFQNSYQMYSNQFIPLTTKANVLDRIKLQGIFDKHFTGGAIAHINVDTLIEDEHQIENLINTCAKMGVVYFAINYVLARCENQHMSVTNSDICPICGSKITDKFTRVVGFLTNTKNWNKTRREIDFPNRQFYKGSEI
jgi:ribonucleoside-triphosphate reductase